MKLTKLSLGCALVTGLMAFAPVQSQAAVIDTNLYVPLNIQVTINYVTNNVIKKATVTSKDVLSKFTDVKGVTLAVFNGDIVIINKTNVIADLSTSNYFTFATGDSIVSSKGTNGVTKYSKSEAGIVNIGFFDDAVKTNIQNNRVAFTLTGNYTLSESDSAPSKGLVSESVSFKASNLSGVGHLAVDVLNTNLPLSGSASASASGKVLPDN